MGAKRWPPAWSYWAPNKGVVEFIEGAAHSGLDLGEIDDRTTRLKGWDSMNYLNCRDSKGVLSSSSWLKP